MLAAAQMLPRWARSILVLALCLVAVQGAQVPANASADVPPVPTLLGTPAPKLSARQLERRIEALYHENARARSFVVQDVEYTPSSLKTVLRSCTTSASETTPQAQTARLLACAPLIFFLYSFGHKDSVPGAVQLADQLYNYAVSQVPGPLDGASVLGGTLRSWGVPVVLRTRPLSSAPDNPEALSLVAESSKAIVDEGSVHVLIRGYSHRGKVLIETISADVGRASSDESLAEGSARAVIKLTPEAAFLHGNAGGLSSLLGMPAALARRAGGRWVEFPKGTSEYRDLAAEDTIARLPASILPLSASGVRLLTTIASGRSHVLSWRAPISGSGTLLAERLVLADGKPLPINERTVAGADVEVASFSRWGDHFSVQVPPPPQVVPYSVVAR